MFEKILIANRGAIATRIQRTLRRLSIRSVAVYAESDADSLHVRGADEAFSLGDGGAADTYLAIDRLLEIAQKTGAQAIHPGYGFLSENPDFVRRCESAGLTFIGPTAAQIEAFGLKHRARDLARGTGVPLVPGTALLSDAGQAVSAATDIGFPVILKSTAGGGGIGMQRCDTAADLEHAFDSVRRLGGSHFGNDGLYLEKYIEHARHIEVQLLGDGRGGVLSLGERDCSAQRRHQKVIEECPAPRLDDAIRQRLHRTAERLMAQVNYRNAGTVEFILDDSTGEFYFLEVNTRLQVEHGVTEAVFGIDLVEYMLNIATGERLSIDTLRDSLAPHGHAIQVRLYTEDPYRDFQPSPGLLSDVAWPQGDGVRVDHWIDSGITVSPDFDPMLGKLIVRGDDRDTALQRLRTALADTRLYGCETNLPYLRQLLDDTVLQEARVTTRYLNDFVASAQRIDVLQPGTLTCVQDWPGRQNYWHVGVPPSGPFDSYAFRLGNRLLGNDEQAAGLEITLQGPSLYFHIATALVLTGASIDATLDDQPIAHWQVIAVSPGQTLSLGRIQGAGARSYLLFAGGLDTPHYLGSRATFTLGQFGGHNGRALRRGDTLRLATDRRTPDTPPRAGTRIPEALLPSFGTPWCLRVIAGPHAAPDFFTDADIRTFYETDWEVHYHASRTGIRLIGPKPQWSRDDGGEAGLHPSNIHDTAYAFGTVDFTGDMPVILGPDGPSLGGFVCPATVIHADLWKLGQLRAGDRVRFALVSLEDAVAMESAQNRAIDTLEPCTVSATTATTATTATPTSPVLAMHEPDGDADRTDVRVCYRVAGDHFLLVEYGPMALDIRLRFRVHALMQWLEAHPFPGMRELTPGIRSLQIHFDSQTMRHAGIIDYLTDAEAEIRKQLGAIRVPSRIVHLPLSWDDDACRIAIDKYTQSVRPGAPWCPSNIEFIRRINGLDSIDAVKRIVFDAAYLVMGLGDVYLGAPVATPLDPRHRLVTTKYNPARTWTAENSVGIGGSYLCVYGMEGPGGYQFIGRTLQMWNRWRQTDAFTRPWLLRHFDQIRFHEVDHHELQQIRRDFPLGRYPLTIEQQHFALADYDRLLDDNREGIAAFTTRRQQAFAEELTRWHRNGQFHFEMPEETADDDSPDWPDNQLCVDSPVAGSVWQCSASAGDRVTAGQVLLVLESMKMEIEVTAPGDGRLSRLLVEQGSRVAAGQVLALIEDGSD